MKETEAKGEEDSVWEYYTETKPSDTEDAKKDAPINSPPSEITTKTPKAAQSEQVSQISAKISTNIPTIHSTDNKPKVLAPVKSKEPVKPKAVPKKHTVNISVIPHISKVK